MTFPLRPHIMQIYPRAISHENGELMQTDLSSLHESALFKHVSQEELRQLFTCLRAKERSFARGAPIFRAGEPVRYVYYILSGSIHIVDDDFWGNSSLVETMYEQTLFAEAYVFSSTPQHLVSVIAAEDSVILEIDPDKLFHTCWKNCSCHATLARNALGIVSEKVVRLTEKLRHVMRRTIREKLLSYLSAYAKRDGCSSFDIPYSRQQLADYLCVDRSALSHELAKLKQQGIIRYHKNHFQLLVEHVEH